MGAPEKNPHTGGISKDTSAPYSMTNVVEISMTRGQLSAYHSALSCAIDHAEEARGNQDKVNFLAALVELSDAALIAIWEFDKVPPAEWDPDVQERALKRKHLPR